MCLHAYALFKSVIHSCASPLLGPRLLFLPQWKPVMDKPLDYPAHAHGIASQSEGEDMEYDHLPPTRPHSISRTTAHPSYWSFSGGSRVNMGGGWGSPNGKGTVCGGGGVRGNGANSSRPTSAYSRLSTGSSKSCFLGTGSAVARNNPYVSFAANPGVHKTKGEGGVGGWTDHVKMRQAAQEWLGAQTRIRNKLQHLLPVPHGSKSRLHVPLSNICVAEHNHIHASCTQHEL